MTVEKRRVVLDTNVLVAAFRSRQGASFELISGIPWPEFEPCLSPGLYIEWQEVLTRPENIIVGKTRDDALAFLRYIAGQSHLQEVYFRWRPFLPDPDDDLVLELAFAAGCRHVITHNVNDFHGSHQLGVTAISPRDYLKLIRS